MSDRYSNLIVVLESDMRHEDASQIMAAIARLRGVVSVKARIADSISECVASSRIRAELSDKLWRALKDDPRSANRLAERET